MRTDEIQALNEAGNVGRRMHTPAYVSIRQHTSAYEIQALNEAGNVGRCMHTPAYVSIRQHTIYKLLMMQET